MLVICSENWTTYGLKTMFIYIRLSWKEKKHRKFNLHGSKKKNVKIPQAESINPGTTNDQPQE